MSLNDHAPADPLWYRYPADDFLDALPLGNGRLGAMTHGGIATERIDLNADTLWSGGPGPRDRAGAAEHPCAVRAAVLRDRALAVTGADERWCWSPSAPATGAGASSPTARRLRSPRPAGGWRAPGVRTTRSSAPSTRPTTTGSPAFARRNARL
ncbi:glycoside hydrolase N-terminal domain-containing protein [Kitasatospora atroaurantiaca]|uniref:glycoside hydrolase N-terminal domain-containing protein n=1 Tax=Kitasatospora atroaurantiaca TaxID=285545 RepID=UPI00119E880F